jgi:SAM-dependent methyltransferase
MSGEKPIAWQAYQKLADAYAAGIDTKPHNAYYDRPAMLSLLPELRGKRVLDAGCGPGAYTEALAAREASVDACDVSERMLEKAAERLVTQIDSGQVRLHLLDLNKPLQGFANSLFDLVNAGLCLDYIEDWRPLFEEFCRLLKPGGCLLFSVGHPAFDADYFATSQYFSVERVTSTWKGFGVTVEMPGYRRPWQAILNPLGEAGLVLDRILEPRPTEDFRVADPVWYEKLMHRPGFVCVRARKPFTST